MHNEEAVLLGLEGAAKVIGISITHLRNLADRKLIPSLRDSAGRRLFLPVDVDRFKEQREQAENGRKVKLKLKTRAQS